MQRYIIIRVLQGILTLVVLSWVIFLLPRMTGEPVFLMVGFDVSQEEFEAVREELGLNKPLVIQYGAFAKDAMRGDFGNSLMSHRPVSELIMQRFPATVKLTLATCLLAVPTGLMLGALCAIRRNKAIDILGRSIAVLGQSLPSFWIGIMLMLLLSVKWGILPTSGMGGPTHYIMPIISMGGFLLAGVTRLTRSSMLEVLGSDYITFARAKGNAESSVILKHALKNAAIPVLTFSAVLFGLLVTGSVVVETVFSWPGTGRLAYQAISQQDFPVIQAIVLLYGAIFISLNLLADILYAWLDPRIRYRQTV